MEIKNVTIKVYGSLMVSALFAIAGALMVAGGPLQLIMLCVSGFMLGNAVSTSLTK